MSVSVSAVEARKNTSSCVRPGVCEVRASALREVSALIRLDLPTLERPANAISTPFIGGSRPIVPTAALNCQSAANSLRPASISDAVKAVIAAARSCAASSVFQRNREMPRAKQESVARNPDTLSCRYPEVGYCGAATVDRVVDLTGA